MKEKDRQRFANRLDDLFGGFKGDGNVSNGSNANIISNPLVKPERRLRAHSRANFSDRRTNERYFADFPAHLYIGSGKDQRIYEARVKDISNGGLAIIAPDVPASETRFRIHFQVPDGVLPEQFIHGPVETHVEVRRKKADESLGVEFEETLSARLARGTWAFLRWLGIGVLAFSFLGILLIKYENIYFFWFDVPVFLYSLLVGLYLVSRYAFASLYRESRTVPREQLPSITVIVPVFNEEMQIGRTIRQIMECDYPAGKMQVIAVNDASTDGTLVELEKSRAIYPDLTILSFDKSRGKREAMAAGAGMAKGEILVFTDSDSFVDTDALHQLMNRFVDPEVASVTGHCDVENIWANGLTKMQTVRYFMAFRIIKAAESIFDSVTCLSGPLAAYRRSVFDTISYEWLHQKFLGRPATFGDDRSLTNALLKRGYKVLYESRARTTTMVPESYRQFLRQQLRWKRSWFRESLLACVFMWKKQPFMSLSFYLGFLLPLLGPVIVLRALLYVPIAQQQIPLMYIGGVFLMSALMSSGYLLFRRSRLWIYGVYFSFYYMFVLVWQLPWAVATCFKSEWGTRS